MEHVFTYVKYGEPLPDNMHPATRLPSRVLNLVERIVIGRPKQKS